MWVPTKNKKYGVAVYNWEGDTRYGLSLEIGDTVQILEECEGWFRGFCSKNRSLKGIFPTSYVCVKSCRVENEGANEVVTPLEDAVVNEVTLVLREWGHIWKKLYLERESYKFSTLRKVMWELLDWRRQMITGTLTQDQVRALQLKITSKVDWGNRKLGLDLVPRVGALMVDPTTMSIVELHQVHVQSSESSQGASARGTVRRPREGPGALKRVLTHHLYFCMRDFRLNVGEDIEIFFSLYDTKRAAYISERFLVKISKEGFSSYVERLHSNCTIFTDLGTSDLNRDIVVVAHVMRVGRMLLSDSAKHKLPQLYRRPYGVAVLNISEFLHKEREQTTPQDLDQEFSFKVYQCEEKDFHTLHEFIIKKQSNKFSPVSGQGNYGIDVSLKLLHGELPQVKEDNALLLKNMAVTRKLGFADVIMPGDVRNDLYLILERGEFERGGKSTGKNIEVTVLVLDNTGKLLDDTLFGASGMDGSSYYQSVVIYHHNSPWWAETIRLAVPIDRFYGAHVRLEFRHCSTRDKTDKKLFGFSFFRLMVDGGATIHDGLHELYIYKCEDKGRLDPAVYLNLPIGAWDPIPGIQDVPSPFGRSTKEVVCVRTLLCSTKLTQNDDLLALLQWKAHPNNIKEALDGVLKLNGEELVKFLQDVLDALFSMFSTEDGSSTAHSYLVFHVLVSIFSLLEDTKFEHFKPVMDAYITGHFAAALVYKGLLSHVQQSADLAQTTDSQEPIQKIFRSLEYIFKFIIQSRLLFARATGCQYEENFKKDLLSVFAAINKMLSQPGEVILPTQISLLTNISPVYEQLQQVLPTIECTQLATAMLASLPRDLPPQLAQAKLTAIRHLVTSKLFHDSESRSLLLSATCTHLRPHLAQRNELKLSSDILADITSYLFKQRESQIAAGKTNVLHHDMEIICISILDMLLQTVLIILDRTATVVGYLVACLVGILQLMETSHYRLIWAELSSRESTKPLKDFLLRLFLVFRDLVKQDVFPQDWFVMKAETNLVMLEALKEFSFPLTNRFLADRHAFDHQLWTNYFNLAVSFLTQPALQLEQFSEVKRNKVVIRYSDLRVVMGFQILEMWSTLGEHKIAFIPSMVGPFMEVTLVPEPELRKATLRIFFDMMEVEQRARGNFKQVESELIDKLDLLISENKGDDEYRQLFNTMEHLSAVLLDRVQSEDPAWRDSGAAFISSVTRLLERLLDYRSVIQGDENRDKRMSCTYNLLNFYKNEIDRKEMYIRYIHKLHDLHLAAENFSEAGFTMKLYADQLTWGMNPLPASPHFPAQPEWQRKEMIYRKIVHYFDKGKCWEQGIPLCKELAELYEYRLFDYSKLSHILNTQAKFFDNILMQLRPEPEYFRVGFYGLSFPLFVRNKVFVYRGLEYERIGAFTQRLQTEFPSAQILMKNTLPEDNIVNSDGQYIQICNVKPLSDNESVFSKGMFPVPEKIASFYQVNMIKKFQSDRPVHKGPIHKDNEFKSLWIERTTLETCNSLPGILRWFEVTKRKCDEIPPVRFACETMENVNAELRQLIYYHTNEPGLNINPLSMRLQGIIDANVMGGIAKYQEAFFVPEFITSHPEFSEFVYKLRALIFDQVHDLEAGLIVHGQLAPPEVQPLHRRLMERLSQMKAGLRHLAPHLDIMQSSDSYHRKMGSIVHMPLPPVPVDKNNPTYEGVNGICSRSSGSSGNYGHLAMEADDIYSKPGEKENGDGSAPPVPARGDIRPKSAGYNTIVEMARNPMGSPRNEYTSLPSVRPTHSREGSIDADHPPVLRKSKPRALSPHMNGNDQSHRNSWPDGEAAPPLPPRGCTPDKRPPEYTPPAPPKRLGANNKNSLDGGDNISNGSGENQSIGSAEWGPVIDASDPPILSPRSQQPPAPPPIPPKGTPPLALSTTPVDPATANENYSVPPRLRSSTMESTNSTTSP
ncbi:dedicator of cytokinesis protein 3 isoform X1 [Neocloeon triangulifer]|uniref:dedicator of cytokinesis protein 3 isoform X1 n=1 Tax=Neocloeon triangulifer TaxID=2078957 RepID=UPI00286F9634|nr:dedicator of cytokinesis protein 3 isoform X1 [Neocloeon triangulifer]